MQYATLLILAFVQVIFSVILSYKRKYKVSRYFLLLSSSLFVWTLCNLELTYILNNFSSTSHYDIRLINLINTAGFFTGTALLLIFYRIMRIFPLEHKENRISRSVTISGSIIILITLIKKVTGYYIVSGSKLVYHYETLTLLLVIIFVIVAVLSIITLSQSLNRHINQEVKSQAKTILAAFIITAGATVFLLLISPLIFNSDKYIFFGYYTPFILSIMIFYSMVKQKFLDFQFIIARSFAYLFTLITFTLAFILVTFTITNYLLTTSPNSPTTRWVYIFLALCLAFAFEPMKKFFDRSTNKYFFRDSYDAQRFLDELNKTIIDNIELGILLQSTALVIQKYLKCEYVIYAIQTEDMKSFRFVDPNGITTITDFNLILRTIEQKEDWVFVYDDLENQEQSLKHALRERKIAVLAKLNPVNLSEAHKQNFLILGYKSSGNPYNSLDIKMLDIIAKEMTISIQNALRFEEIQNFNTTLQEKVFEATRKLRRANEKLRALDETKDDFISMASHQLRTPLTSIKGYLSMLLDGDAGELSPTQKDMISQAFISSQRMVFLIADMLNVSRLKTGKFVIEAKEVQLSTLIEEEINQLKETAAAKSIEIEYSKPEDFPVLMLDETKIRQVIMNFSDNAIYYTPEGGKITIQLLNKEHSIELRVKDNGIGVPKSEQHHLFTKFYRATNARKARPDGTGLGLYMAKKVIIGLGGAIIFESSEGKGSTFGFIFPKK